MQKWEEMNQLIQCFKSQGRKPEKPNVSNRSLQMMKDEYSDYQRELK